MYLRFIGTHGGRVRALLPGIALLALLAVPASAMADGTLTVGPGKVVKAYGGTAQADVTTAPRGALPTGNSTYNPTIAAKTKKPTAPSSPQVLAAAPFAPPASQTQFNGEDIASCCLRPPDTHGAVGHTQFVEVTNGEGVSVFNKSTGAKLSQTSLASFFSYSAQSIFDPRAVYDKVWNRWVISAEAFPESSTIQRVFFAISRGIDATAGGWCVYSFDAPEPGLDDFYDFPQLGMDRDALIMTANIFDSGVGPYLRTRMLGIAKSDVYNCRGFSAPYFDLGAVGTVAPPIVEDNNSNAYLVGNINSTTVRLWRATNLGRSGATVAVQADIPIPAVSGPPPMRQPGTAGTIDSSDGRFQNASSQIGDALLNIHTIGSGSFPIPKWYQFDTEGAGANTVFSSGFVFEGGTSDDANPAIVGSPVGATPTNPIGRMFFTWNSTDAVNGTVALRHQMRVKGGGRLESDPTTVTGGSNFGTAPAAYDPTGDNPERWGDYSAITLDPAAGCGEGQRAWLVNELQTSSALWGSRIGRLGFC